MGRRLLLSPCDGPDTWTHSLYCGSTLLSDISLHSSSSSHSRTCLVLLCWLPPTPFLTGDLLCRGWGGFSRWGLFSFINCDFNFSNSSYTLFSSSYKLYNLWEERNISLGHQPIKSPCCWHCTCLTQNLDFCSAFYAQITKSSSHYTQLANGHPSPLDDYSSCW